MIRPKIKLDIGNYLSLEKRADFKNTQEKVFSIVSDLYSTTSNENSRTGWLSLHTEDKMFFQIKEFVEIVKREEKYNHVVVLGIGGSSLGAQALIDGLRSPLWNRLSGTKRKGFLTIDFIDNLDPQIIRNVLDKLNLKKTLFIVISKGGNTIETIVPMLIAKEWTEDFYKQCVFVTTENSGLLFGLSKKFSVPLFHIPENIGGRYSVFSPAGLLPAALAGINLDEIKEGIKEAFTMCKAPELKINLAAVIALCAYFSYIAGRNILVLMPYSTCLKRFSEWFVQLWAESLGKNRKGSTPLSACGATDQHSQLQLFNEGPGDKLIGFIKIAKHKRDLTIPDFSNENQEFLIYAGHKVGQILNIELEATKKALTENEKPNFTITLPELDEYYLSQLMFIFEVATSICGRLLGVNPFDQPGVELAKKYTKEALAHN